MSLDDRADELDRKLEENDIDKSIDTLVRGAKRQRMQLRLLTISIALDFVLTVGLAVLSIRTSEVAQLSQSNHAAVVLNCETANDSRANQRELWGYVLSLTPQQPRTPEQQDRVNQFSKFVDSTFARRDCEAEANR